MTRHSLWSLSQCICPLYRKWLLASENPATIDGDAWPSNLLTVLPLVGLGRVLCVRNGVMHLWDHQNCYSR